MSMPVREREIARKIWKLQIKFNRIKNKKDKKLDDFFLMEEIAIKVHLLKLERKRVRRETYYNSNRRGKKK